MVGGGKLSGSSRLLGALGTWCVSGKVSVVGSGVESVGMSRSGWSNSLLKK